MSAGLPVHYADAATRRSDGGVTEYVTHADPDNSGLVQAVLGLTRGARAARDVPAGREEVLYVLGGSGYLVRDGRRCELAPDVAVLAPGPARYEVVGDGPGQLEIVCVSGRSLGERAAPVRERLDLTEQIAQDAVSEREFRVLHDPGSGCSGVTQFVGYIPQVRAARHYHPYSEMLFVVGGEGSVEIDGHEQHVSRGWCFYLPTGTAHLVENRSADEHLRLLGVFTPPGSPDQAIPIPEDVS